MGCPHYMGKCIFSFVSEKLALTVAGMETKEEFPPDSKIHIRKCTKQSNNCVEVPLRVLGTVTHSSDRLK